MSVLSDEQPRDEYCLVYWKCSFHYNGLGHEVPIIIEKLLFYYLVNYKLIRFSSNNTIKRVKAYKTFTFRRYSHRRINKL